MTAQVCSNEAFAPLVVAFPFRDLDEAIARVNDSMFGLQTGVFTNDLAGRVAGVRASSRSAASSSTTSRPTGSTTCPTAASRTPGLGREGLRYAMEDMTEIRIMVLAQPGSHATGVRRRPPSRGPRRGAASATRRVAHPWRDGPDPDARPARAPGARPRLRARRAPAARGRVRAGRRARPARLGRPDPARPPSRRGCTAARSRVEVGGQGWSVLEQVLVHEQLGQSTGGLWSYIPGAYNVLIHADPDQRRRYLDPIAARRALGELRDHRGRRRLRRPDAARDRGPRRGDRRVRPQRREVVRDRARTTPTS